MKPRICAINSVMALVLAGCSMPLGEAPPEQPVEPTPPYRKIILDQIRSGLLTANKHTDTEKSPDKASQTGPFKDPSRLGVIEISGPRQVLHLTGWVWRVCLRVDAQRNPVTYAIFIRNSDVVD